MKIQEDTIALLEKKWAEKEPKQVAVYMGYTVDYIRKVMSGERNLPKVFEVLEKLRERRTILLRQYVRVLRDLENPLLVEEVMQETPMPTEGEKKVECAD